MRTLAITMVFVLLNGLGFLYRTVTKPHDVAPAPVLAAPAPPPPLVPAPPVASAGAPAAALAIEPAKAADPAPTTIAPQDAPLPAPHEPPAPAVRGTPAGSAVPPRRVAPARQPGGRSRVA